MKCVAHAVSLRRLEEARTGFDPQEATELLLEGMVHGLRAMVMAQQEPAATPAS
jgi:hypothetical protein